MKNAIWRRFVNVAIGLILITGVLLPKATAQEQEERENIYMRLLAVNPSKEEVQVVSIKEYLPQEVTLKDIISTGGLNVEYDTEKGLYYVYKEKIVLPAGKTLTFSVELKDIWYIAEDKLNTLKTQTASILDSMANSPQYSTLKAISDEIDIQIAKIITSQKEAEGVSFKQQIATYRDNINILNSIQENIERMRNAWVSAGKGEGYSERAMLEESKLKSDIPSKTATWMVIFIIMTFILILGAAFFFAWVRSTRSIEKTTSEATESSFSAPEGESKEKEEATAENKTTESKEKPAEEKTENKEEQEQTGNKEPT